MKINLKSGIYDETDNRMLTHFLFQIDALLSKWETQCRWLVDVWINVIRPGRKQNSALSWQVVTLSVADCFTYEWPAVYIAFHTG